MPQIRPLRVLVVDDHPESAESSAQLLAICGHEARAAHTCREAVAAVAPGGFEPEVVLLDVRLPDGDGCALAAELCRLLPHRPALVAVTGLSGEEERCRAAGFDGYLLKPVEPAALRAVLESYARKVAGD